MRGVVMKACSVALCGNACCGHASLCMCGMVMYASLLCMRGVVKLFLTLLVGGGWVAWSGGTGLASLIGMRITMGIGEGPTFPAIHSIISRRSSFDPSRPYSAQTCQL